MRAMTEQVIKQKMMPFGFLVIAAMTLTTGYWMKGTLPTQNPLLTSDSPVKAEEDRPKTNAPAPSQPKETAIKYRPFIIQGAKSIAELKAKTGEDGFNTVLKINRLDHKHVGKGTTLFIPETKIELLALSPLPQELEFVSHIEKLVVVSRRAQAFGAYESGRLVYWGPTSTGKKATPTPAKLYSTNWRKKVTRSTVNSAWVLPWYFNLDMAEGIAFHQYDLPGYPASHGCVRLMESDAIWMYNWADQFRMSRSGAVLAHGTAVLVFGDYAYGQAAPWKKLDSDPKAASVSIKEIEEALQKHLPTIEARARARENFIAAAGPLPPAPKQ
jgi:lipoprotein-anchoring transpeptidase ErfK/SrfK